MNILRLVIRYAFVAPFLTVLMFGLVWMYFLCLWVIDNETETLRWMLRRLWIASPNSVAK